VAVKLWCKDGAHTVAGPKFVTFTKFDIYGSGRTTKARLDEAMVEMATRPGLATSYTSKPVGPAMDDLRVGNGTEQTTIGAGLDTVSKLHSQPFDWAFWDDKTFDVRPALWTPDNDARVIVVGAGEDGLESWDVAEYDEDVPDYAEVIFGNKDDADLPEGWPRRIFRPSNPPDDNVKLKRIDHSSLILTDDNAAAIGDYAVGKTLSGLSLDAVLDLHPERARLGTWPGNNDDPTSTYQDLSNYRATGALTGFSYTTTSGWAGTNSPADPTALVCNGASESALVTFADAAQHDFITGARTIRAWVNTSDPTATQAILSKWAGGNNAGYECSLESDGKLYAITTVNYGAGTYRAAKSATVLTANTWYCVHFVYGGSGGDWDIWINAVDDAATNSGTAGALDSDNAVALTIAREGAAASSFRGKLGRVTMWPRALTESEITADYEDGQCIYARSAYKGTVVLQGQCKTRTGSPIPAHHIRAGYWIQNTQLGSGQPLYITGHSVDLAGQKNSLTIGRDWMEDEIGVREAELLSIPATEVTETESNPDPWENWRL
jgi:hypothetical protein